MIGRSLQLRLIIAGFVAVLAALTVAWFALGRAFERHVERRAIAEAETSLRMLIVGARLSPAGVLSLTNFPPDPRFNEAYSGVYWQVEKHGVVIQRSRSLWDFELPTPDDVLAEGKLHVHALQGPRGAHLLAIERQIILLDHGAPEPIRLIIAFDRADIFRARDEFMRDLIAALAFLGAGLVLASIVQVRIGLAPLKAMRQHIQRIRTGEQPRLTGNFPQEVTPLADEINVLLNDRDEAIARARSRAADLAHGLKTALSALNSDVRRLQAEGRHDIAADIEALSAMMLRHVNRELARARIAGRRHGARILLARPIVEAVAAVVARAPQALGKGFDFAMDRHFAIAMDRADFEEVLGNLLENAMRHAKNVVQISGFVKDGAACLLIADDGPGVAPEDLPGMQKRGERLDETGDGAGLGLAIVRDVIDAYKGAIHFGPSAMGGLAVQISIPLETA